MVDVRKYWEKRGYKEHKKDDFRNTCSVCKYLRVALLEEENLCGHPNHTFEISHIGSCTCDDWDKRIPKDYEIKKSCNFRAVRPIMK